MDEYRHHVSGFFPRREAAENAFSLLVERGLPPERLRIFAAADSEQSIAGGEGASNEALTDVLVDGAIGTVIGTGVGLLAEVALVAANVTLFIASPLIAPLAMLGWGAGLGGLIGAAAGATTGAAHKEGALADLIHDAILSGQVVLVVETRTEQETASAREVIQAAVGAVEDLNTG